MSKALVIKGANFADNKVATITLNEPVPCTGVALSQPAIAFTEVGATEQLIATKTPIDTTDELIWTSSNPDVATVEDGLVTCIGVGTATITVMCGTQSATCAVTSTLTIIADDTWYVDDGHNYNGSVSLPTKNYIARSTNAAGRLFYSTTDVLGGYRAFVNKENEGRYAIPFPTGTTKVTFLAPNDATKFHLGFAVCDTTQKQTYVTGALDGAAALAKFGTVIFNMKNVGEGWPFDVGDYIADGANGFIFSYTFVDPSAVTDVTGKVTVIFS